MSGQELARAGRLSIITAIAGLALATPAGAASPEPSGAPKAATVRLDALQSGVPPAAFGIACLTLPDCTTSGDAVFHTQATVPVKYAAAENVSVGAGPLGYETVVGYVARTITCRGASPAVSSRQLLRGVSGELAVSALRAGPDENTLAVTLDPAGESGGALPKEVVRAGEGGCGVPHENHLLDMTVWNANFTGAHEGEWQRDGGFRIDGLAWDENAEAFTRDYVRPVSVGFGPLAYTYQENTQLEVRPEYCDGPLNRVSSATAKGESLGINGLRLFAGQIVSAPPGSKFRFADGAVIEVDKGGSFAVDECPENRTDFTITQSVKKFWVEVKKALSGSKAKFNVRTDRAVCGVRGTKYELSYDKPKQLTRVAVKEGVVSLKGIHGAKGQILVKAGQVGIQKGRRKPKIVKR